jgi:hypothetical protein
MVRSGYRLNDDDTTLLPIFPIPAGLSGAPASGAKALRRPGRASRHSSQGLTGFQAMAKKRGIDWGRFIDIGSPRPYGGDPDEVKPPSADMKNIGLPTGQSVAKAMGVTPLTDDQIIIGKAVDTPGDDDVLGPISELTELSAFWGKCPLWTYILAEAAATRATVSIPVTPSRTISTPQLGNVGGRIVAEVFLGMLFGDNDSFLRADPDWIPTIGNAKSQFALRDIVAYALGM